MKQCLLTLVVTLPLYACGGGGSSAGSTTTAVIPPVVSDEGASTGTAIIAVGTIDGFGSIYVNGIKYDTDDAEIDNDGEEASEASLATGMIVRVDGTVSEDGVSGKARRVFYDSELKGQITDIATTDSDDSKALTVLDITVIVERTATVFEDTDFELLTVGEWIEVYGTKDVGGVLTATRVEAEDSITAQEAGIELKGTVSGVTDTEFGLGTYTVNYAAAVFEDGNIEDLIDGAYVEVNGTLEGGVITAMRIEFEGLDKNLDSDSDDDSSARLSIEGIVADFESQAVFSVRGIAVDATNARLEPSNLVIENGVYLEVKGPVVDGVLQATKVELERGDIEFYAIVDNIDERSFTVTLSGVATVIQVNSRTLFEDDRNDNERANFSDLAVGDKVEIEAYQDTEGAFIATRVDIKNKTNDDDDDEIEVKGPVTDFVASTSITVANTTFNVDASTRYEIGEREDLTAEVFFADLAIGDLVEIKDNQPADGIADEVELETNNDDDDDDDD